MVQIDRYLNRLDIVREDPDEGIVLDFLNDKKDSEGFKSYFTITWGNDEHIFTATKKYISQVIVGYERKQSKKGNTT
jgi:hypothetical protein